MPAWLAGWLSLLGNWVTRSCRAPIWVSLNAPWLAEPAEKRLGAFWAVEQAEGVLAPGMERLSSCWAGKTG